MATPCLNDGILKEVEVIYDATRCRADYVDTIWLASDVRQEAM